MKRPAVIDANVAVAVAVTLPYSDAAERAMSVYRPIAPDCLALEVASGLGKAVRTGHAASEDARVAFGDLLVTYDLIPTLPLGREAYELGLRLAHSPHDCVYLILAEREGVPLVSNDQKFLRKAATFASVALVNLSDMPETLP